MNASTQLVVDVMARERAANAPRPRRGAAKSKTPAKRTGGRGTARAPASQSAPAKSGVGKPVVRKVQPRSKASRKRDD